MLYIYISDAGTDIRWVGNEQGWAGKTNWCLLKREDFAPGLVPDPKFLQQGQEDGTYWVPAEVDVSIRPGWFYHPEEDDKVKTLSQLLDIYYHSIGRNASLLLNFPVDTRGLIHENDIQQIMKLAKAIETDFSFAKSKAKSVSTSNIGGNSKRLV